MNQDKNSLMVGVSALVILGFIVISNGVFAWTSPTASFSGNNTEPPFHTGLGYQIKSGGLIIQGLQSAGVPYATSFKVSKGDVIIGDPTQSILVPDATSTVEIIGGGITLTDGTEGEGKVLIATDAYGSAEWGSPTYTNKIIMAFNGVSCPDGWSLADGTNGKPDLRGRNIIGSGQGALLTNRPLGSVGGEERHLFTSNEMYHRHNMQSVRVGRDGGNSEDFGDIVTDGPDFMNSFNVMDPYYVLTYCVQD